MAILGVLHHVVTRCFEFDEQISGVWKIEPKQEEVADEGDICSSKRHYQPHARFE